MRPPLILNKLKARPETAHGVSGFTTWIIDVFKNMIIRFTFFGCQTAAMMIIIMKLPQVYDKYGTITAVKIGLIP